MFIIFGIQCMHCILLWMFAMYILSILQGKVLTYAYSYATYTTFSYVLCIVRTTFRYYWKGDEHCCIHFTHCAYTSDAYFKNISFLFPGICMIMYCIIQHLTERYYVVMLHAVVTGIGCVLQVNCG